MANPRTAKDLLVAVHFGEDVATLHEEDRAAAESLVEAIEGYGWRLTRADDVALTGHIRHGEVLEERDAMQRRAEAAEADWQAAVEDLRLIGAWWNGIGRVYQSGSKASGEQHSRWEAAVPALERAAQAATGEGSGLTPTSVGSDQ